MIFGCYPDVINNPGDESDLLRELAGSYLYKDILTWERIQKPEKLERLVRALALQLGSEVEPDEDVDFTIIIFKLADNSDVWVKLASGEDPSSPEEEARMSLLVRAILRGFESQCYQAEVGLIEETEWRALRNAIVNICGLPGVRKYWMELKPYMSERLQNVVERNESGST